MIRVCVVRSYFKLSLSLSPLYTVMRCQSGSKIDPDAAALSTARHNKSIGGTRSSKASALSALPAPRLLGRGVSVRPSRHRLNLCVGGGGGVPLKGDTYEYTIKA